MMRHNTAKWLGALLLLIVLAAGVGVLWQRNVERQAEEACVAEIEACDEAGLEEEEVAETDDEFSELLTAE